MSLLFGKKKSVPEEMRMHYSAPSFSFSRGSVTSPWTRDEAKAIKSEYSDAIVLVHPGINMLLYPKDWVKILSDAYYVIILASKTEEPIVELRKAFEKEIYSPVAKHISGVSVASTIDEASAILSSIVTMSEKRVVTLNNTEEEIQ